MLVGVFVVGLFRLWRTSPLTHASLLLICGPALIGCSLATLQSLIAVRVVRMNELGMVHLSYPERYIGHILIFLYIGVAMSIVLFCVSYFKRQKPSASEDRSR